MRWSRVFYSDQNCPQKSCSENLRPSSFSPNAFDDSLNLKIIFSEGREFSVVVIIVHRKAMKKVCDRLVFCEETFDDDLNPKHAF